VRLGQCGCRVETGSISGGGGVGLCDAKSGGVTTNAFGKEDDLWGGVSFFFWGLSKISLPNPLCGGRVSRHLGMCFELVCVCGRSICLPVCVGCSGCVCLCAYVVMMLSMLYLYYVVWFCECVCECAGVVCLCACMYVYVRCDYVICNLKVL